MKTILWLGLALTLLMPMAVGKAQATESKALTRTALYDLQTYCNKINLAVSEHKLKPRFFVDLSAEGGKLARWQEFKDQAGLDKACADANCVQQAWVYVDAGKPVLAAFTLGSAKGDWANNVDLYFYLNGKVAKNHAEMRRQGARDPEDKKALAFMVEVQRTHYFSRDGRVLAKDKPLVYKVSDSSKDLILGAKFIEAPWPQYKSVKELPMASFLKSTPKP